MRLIVGLGNPGEKYKNNRHNVGFMVLEAAINSLSVGQSAHAGVGLIWQSRFDGIFLRYKLEPVKFLLLKPWSFMNNSGVVVSQFLKDEEILPRDLLVVHDDLDINLGLYKLQFGKGPRQHNGIISIEDELKTKDFWRLRVGIENRDQNQALRIKGEDYVLQDFTAEEREKLDKLIEGEIILEIKNWLLKK